MVQLHSKKKYIKMRFRSKCEVLLIRYITIIVVVTGVVIVVGVLVVIAVVVVVVLVVLVTVVILHLNIIISYLYSTWMVSGVRRPELDKLGHDTHHKGWGRVVAQEKRE